MGYTIPNRYTNSAVLFLLTIFSRLKNSWAERYIKKEIKSPEFLEVFEKNRELYDGLSDKELALQFKFCIIEKIKKDKGFGYSKYGLGTKLFIQRGSKNIIFCDPRFFYYLPNGLDTKCVEAKQILER